MRPKDIILTKIIITGKKLGNKDENYHNGKELGK